MNYERTIAFAAGPISIVAGYLATQLTTHIGLFGSLGVSKDQTARAIVTVGTFATGAVVTYAAHHKWLSNVPKWWDTQGATQAVGLVEADAEHVLADKLETAITPDPGQPDTTAAAPAATPAKAN